MTELGIVFFELPVIELVTVVVTELGIVLVTDVKKNVFAYPPPP